MKVTLWPAGDHNTGTGQYRLFMPGFALHKQGADVTVDMGGAQVIRMAEAGFKDVMRDHVVGLASIPEADVVVMQRPGSRKMAETIPLLQKEGIRVVVDVDDLFDRIDEGNVAQTQFSPLAQDFMNFNWIDEACKMADVVTCTTPALKARYGFGHGHVLPNLVPQSYLSLETDKRPRTVGWTGTVDTHPKDLQITRGAIGKAIADHPGWYFHHIGTGKGLKDALGLPREPTYSGWVPFDQYPSAMQQVEIGIVPLADTPFNKAKSCLKMIEFAALGVPVVASACPDNLRMYQLGVGAIVKHPAQWFKRLTPLMESAEARADLAGKSRITMSKHTYEEQCWRWAEVWGL